MAQLPVSAIVSTKNEEAAIHTCVAGLRDFDEVIVVDSMSTDSTVELARAAGARVINFDWKGVYPKKKQWCLDNVDTRHPWILFIDSDERPTPELIAEIGKLVARPEAAVAYDIPLDYHFGGKQLRHGHKVSKRVLLRRDAVRFPEVDDLDAPGMGELEGHYQPEAYGPVGRTKAKLLHDDPDPVSTWIDRHNRYSDWEAYIRRNPRARASVRAHKTGQGNLFDRAPFKPLAFFLYSYVGRGGFLDGRAGFDYAFGLAWYYWLIQVKVRESQSASASAKSEREARVRPS